MNTFVFLYIISSFINILKANNSKTKIDFPFIREGDDCCNYNENSYFIISNKFKTTEESSTTYTLCKDKCDTIRCESLFFKNYRISCRLLVSFELYFIKLVSPDILYGDGWIKFTNIPINHTISFEYKLISSTNNAAYLFIENTPFKIKLGSAMFSRKIIFPMRFIYELFGLITDNFTLIFRIPLHSYLFITDILISDDSSVYKNEKTYLITQIAVTNLLIGLRTEYNFHTGPKNKIKNRHGNHAKVSLIEHQEECRCYFEPLNEVKNCQFEASIESCVNKKTGLLVGDRFKDVETLVEIEYKKRNMLEVHSELIIEILYKLYSTVELTESLINSIFSFHSYHNELIDFTHSIERVDGYYKQKFYLAMPINEEIILKITTKQNVLIYIESIKVYTIRFSMFLYIKPLPPSFNNQIEDIPCTIRTLKIERFKYFSFKCYIYYENLSIKPELVLNDNKHYQYGIQETKSFEVKVENILSLMIFPGFFESYQISINYKLTCLTTTNENNNNNQNNNNGFVNKVMIKQFLNERKQQTEMNIVQSSEFVHLTSKNIEAGERINFEFTRSKDCDFKLQFFLNKNNFKSIAIKELIEKTTKNTFTDDKCAWLSSYNDCILDINGFEILNGYISDDRKCQSICDHRNLCIYNDVYYECINRTNWKFLIKKSDDISFGRLVYLFRHEIKKFKHTVILDGNPCNLKITYIYSDGTKQQNLSNKQKITKASLELDITKSIQHLVIEFIVDGMCSLLIVSKEESYDVLNTNLRIELVDSIIPHQLEYQNFIPIKEQHINKRIFNIDSIMYLGTKGFVKELVELTQNSQSGSIKIEWDNQNDHHSYYRLIYLLKCHVKCRSTLSIKYNNDDGYNMALIEALSWNAINIFKPLNSNKMSLEFHITKNDHLFVANINKNAIEFSIDEENLPFIANIYNCDYIQKVELLNSNCHSENEHLQEFASSTRHLCKDACAPLEDAHYCTTYFGIEECKNNEKLLVIGSLNAKDNLIMVLDLKYELLVFEMVYELYGIQSTTCSGTFEIFNKNTNIYSKNIPMAYNLKVFRRTFSHRTLSMDSIKIVIDPDCWLTISSFKVDSLTNGLDETFTCHFSYLENLGSIYQTICSPYFYGFIYSNNGLVSTMNRHGKGMIVISSYFGRHNFKILYEITEKCLLNATYRLNNKSFNFKFEFTSDSIQQTPILELNGDISIEVFFIDNCILTIKQFVETTDSATLLAGNEELIISPTEPNSTTEINHKLFPNRGKESSNIEQHNSNNGIKFKIIVLSTVISIFGLAIIISFIIKNNPRKILSLNSFKSLSNRSRESIQKIFI